MVVQRTGAAQTHPVSAIVPPSIILNQSRAVEYDYRYGACLSIMRSLQ